MPSLTVSMSCRIPGCAGALPLIVHCKAPGDGVHIEVNGDGNPGCTGSASCWYEKVPVSASLSASLARYSTVEMGVPVVCVCAPHIATPSGGVLQVHGALGPSVFGGAGAIARKGSPRRRTSGSDPSARSFLTGIVSRAHDRADAIDP